MGRRSRRSRSRIAAAAVSLLASALLAVVISEVFGIHLYYGWIAASSFVTLILFGADKFSSKLKRGRVPEVVLHLMGLTGGFIGGWLGMLMFLHKVRKLEFILVLSASTLLHASIWFFLIR